MMDIDLKDLQIEEVTQALPVVFGAVKDGKLDPVSIGLLFGLVSRMAAVVNGGEFEEHGPTQQLIIYGFSIGCSDVVHMTQATSTEELYRLAEQMQEEHPDCVMIFGKGSTQ